MKSLSKNWIIEDIPDFEYKKYLLLAYLQAVKASFEEKKIFPFLSDLVTHYRNLKEIKESQEEINRKKPRNVSGIDWEKLRLLYESEKKDGGSLEELEQIIQFSLPRIARQIEDGKTIYQDIENHLLIAPVGLLPLRVSEGYLMLREQKRKITEVYHYQVSLFEDASEAYRSLATQHLGTWTVSLSKPYEKIKAELIHANRDLPNPATFIIESRESYPVQESLFPVAKRSLMRYVALLEKESPLGRGGLNG